jgi:hypothetical protein
MCALLLLMACPAMRLTVAAFEVLPWPGALLLALTLLLPG